jgi:hypothetical protein
MTDNKKVFVCVVFHHSQNIRPNGSDVIMEFCDAWRKHKFPYTLCILDNESDISYDTHLKDIEHHMIRVDDQNRNGGLTGAWNQLCRYAVDAGAEIITGFNDDVMLNGTFNEFIKHITDDNTVYAPLTNGLGGGPWQFQRSDDPKPGFRHTSNIVNGFWFGFTRKLFLDKNVKGDLLSKKYSSVMDNWGGQEFVFSGWHREFNTHCITIGDCWLEHTKLRSWKTAQNTYK